MRTKQHALAFGFKLLWRDWKGGELSLLLASLILAVATVTSISVFSSRVQNAIYDEASQFIAADAKVSGSMPIPPEWFSQSQDYSLNSAQVTDFRAMAFSATEMTLSQVKGVSNSYPLKGQLLIADDTQAPSQIVTHGPKPGEAWLAPRLFEALKLKQGDSISIGEASFTVTAVIVREPDGGQSVFGVAPRIMINLDDINRTQALQLGSRANYSLLLAGDTAKLEAYKTHLTDELGEHFRWNDAKSGNRSLGNAIARAENFLFLTACLSVILTGVAIALSASRYAKRQQQKVALLKTLGAKPQFITALYAVHLCAIGVCTAAIGLLLGGLLQWGIIFVLGDLIPKDLAAASPSAYITGAVTAFVALLAFAAPPILALRNIAPSAIFREQHSQRYSPTRGTFFGAVAMIVLMLLFTRDLKLTFLVSVGVGISIGCVGLVSTGLISVSKYLAIRLPYSWRIGLANLKRHQRFNTLQIIIFSLLFLVLFVLISLRTTLISQWQNQLPSNAPNHFIFNVFPNDAKPLQAFFVKNNIAPKPFYPMTRGRITHINGITTEVLTEGQKNQSNYERELNLTWSNTLGSDNKIIAGQWWQATPTNSAIEVSVEQEYAEGLALNVGDSMAFSIAGQVIDARVASLRTVKWDSMNPNFFVIFNQDVLSASGANWITSFYLAPDQKPLLNTLVRQFPTVSLIELDQTLAQIRDITDKVSMAIEFILLLVLGAGLLVLITSIQATLDIRKKQSAIFRALGAPKSLVRLTLLIEFFALGLLAGILATIGTEVCLFLLQTQVFELDYQPTVMLWFIGPLISATLIVAIGWQSTKVVVRTPPLEVLKGL